MKRAVLILGISLSIMAGSCARAPVKQTRPAGTIEPFHIPPERVITAPEAARSDVIHEVAPGETLWRISKMYEVPIEDIARANRITDYSKLEKGQKLLIPNAAPLKLVVPLYPSNKWRYIIIHHSATDVGDALSFDFVHSKKRHWKGLGYHFVIDNGTSGKQDGQIEVSPRWLHQEDGAHCKADGMNHRGIGICLVGNFDEERVTSRQMESLIFLVKELTKYYGIPYSHILGHGQVRGASTDCPGKKFPWREFWFRLKE